ncbi:MAG: hypothetical protein KJZ93_13040 [Caldilineaceae bacterium]|nr:hypothetical protein [Caldilineaceae bacterium]
MSVAITIEVSNTLEKRLRPYRHRLPEVLERGLRELATDDPVALPDADAIIELLVSQPTSEQVLAIRPSPELQARVSELLARNKEGILSRQEEIELDRYLTLEHLVRLAKSKASAQLAASQ